MYKFFLWALGLHIILLILMLLNFSFFSTKNPVSNSSPIKAVAINPNTVKPAAVKPSPPVDKPVEKPVEKPPVEQKKTEPKSEPKPADTKAMTELQKKLDDAKINIKKKPEPKKEPPKKQEPDEKLLEKQLEKKVTPDPKKTKAEKEQTLQEQLAAESEAESKAEEAAVAAAAMQGEVDKYKGLILESLRQHWIVPDNVSPELSATLLIRLAPGGMVLDVQLIKSSGDPALDRSAIAAVHKASPLPVPTDALLFNQMREISLIVKPESK